MGDTVKAINIITSPDNAAAVNERIAALVAQNYSGPEWKKQGPNFIQNTATGEVLNLNQLAVASLQAEGPRQDAVATVQDTAGANRSVFIPQDAVAAAGGNLLAVAQRLQQVLDEPGPVQIPLWVYGLGAMGVAYLLFRRPAHGRHF